ncbi:serine hydrolase [Phytohabitans sp. ZYX-F-186]|uniref:Serine hydrolase n=1 Tax=Phytohabitans maris TaxID=3071409 RepID=A0ABU0ZRL8_9ACTN|nr:serine hydrolase [Phytohabitans sp. ZYX-F-186]MDQ7909649.1 serine hydrolase [Phytohabitans sp. ZYX-F-186]
MLDDLPPGVSVYIGPLDGPARHTRLPEKTHYAASTMKVAVLAALHRSGADLDAEVPVHNVFASAASGMFGCTRDYDSDGDVWARLGGTAPLGWLADRMITRSSNLATNILLGHVGLGAVAGVWASAGARHSVTARGIEDYAAREAGLDNLVTAADLAALFTAIVTGKLGPPEGMVGTLLRQERTEDLAAGLPPGTRIAHKNGWVDGVRHGAGVVFPDDAPPYAIAVCTTTDMPDAGACALIARVSAAAWEGRFR